MLEQLQRVSDNPEAYKAMKKERNLFFLALSLSALIGVSLYAMGMISDATVGLLIASSGLLVICKDMSIKSKINIQKGNGTIEKPPLSLRDRNFDVKHVFMAVKVTALLIMANIALVSSEAAVSKVIILIYSALTFMYLLVSYVKCQRVIDKAGSASEFVFRTHDHDKQAIPLSISTVSHMIMAVMLVVGWVLSSHYTGSGYFNAEDLFHTAVISMFVMCLTTLRIVPKREIEQS